MVLTLTTSAGFLVAALLSRHAVQKMIMRHDKVIFLMHAGNCPRANEFAPILERVAQEFADLRFGRIDVDVKVKVAAADGVQPGAPALKALFRNAPPGRRVLVYAGPPTFESVLEWAKAVEEWDGSDTLAKGWQIGRAEAKDAVDTDAPQADPTSNTAKQSASARPDNFGSAGKDEI